MLICSPFSQIKGAQGQIHIIYRVQGKNANVGPFAPNQGKDAIEDSNILNSSLFFWNFILYLSWGFYILLKIILSKEKLKYKIISNAKYLIMITTKNYFDPSAGNLSKTFGNFVESKELEITDLQKHLGSSVS